MYDRVKARPRCDSVKSKKSQKKRNGKSKKSRNRSESDEETSSQESDNNSGLSDDEDVDKSDENDDGDNDDDKDSKKSNKMNSDSNCEENELKKSKKSSSKKKHNEDKNKKSKKSKKIEVSSDGNSDISDDSVSLSEMDEEKKQQLFKQFLKERKANKNNQKNRKRHQSNSSLFDSEESEGLKSADKQKSGESSSLNLNKNQDDHNKKTKMANKKPKLDNNQKQEENEFKDENNVEMKTEESKMSTSESDDDSTLQAQTIGSLQDSLFNSKKSSSSKTIKNDKVKLKDKAKNKEKKKDENKEKQKSNDDETKIRIESNVFNKEPLKEEIKDPKEEAYLTKSEEAPILTINNMPVTEAPETLKNISKVESPLNKQDRDVEASKDEEMANEQDNDKTIESEKLIGSREDQNIVVEEKQAENEITTEPIEANIQNGPVKEEEIKVQESIVEQLNQTTHDKNNMLNDVEMTQGTNENTNQDTYLTKTQTSPSSELGEIRKNQSSLETQQKIIKNEESDLKVKQNITNFEFQNIEQEVKQVEVERKIEQSLGSNEIEIKAQKMSPQIQQIQQQQQLENNHMSNNYPNNFDVLIEAIQLEQPLSKHIKNELENKHNDINTNIKVEQLNKINSTSTTSLSLTPSSTPLPPFIANYSPKAASLPIIVHHNQTSSNTETIQNSQEEDIKQQKIRNIHAELTNSVNKINPNQHELETHFSHFVSHQQQQHQQNQQSQFQLSNQYQLYQPPQLIPPQQQNKIQQECPIQFSQPTPPPSQPQKLPKTPTPTNNMEKLIFDQIQQQQQPLKLNKSQTQLNIPTQPYGMPNLLNQTPSQLIKQPEQLLKTSNNPPTKSPIIPPFYQMDHQQTSAPNLFHNPLFPYQIDTANLQEVLTKYPFLPQQNIQHTQNMSHFNHKPQQPVQQQQSQTQQPIIQTSPKISKQEISKQSPFPFNQNQEKPSNILYSNPQLKVSGNSHKRSATPKEMAKELAAKQQQQQQQEAKIHFNHQPAAQHNYYQGILEANSELLRPPYGNPVDFRLSELYPPSLFMASRFPDAYPHPPHTDYMTQMMSQMHQSPFVPQIVPPPGQPQTQPLPSATQQQQHLPQHQEMSHRQTQIINTNQSLIQNQAHNFLSEVDSGRTIWTSSFVLKNDSVTVSMNFLFGNIEIAKCCITQMNMDGLNMPIRISQRMRLEQNQLEGVQKKLQMVNEHCVLIALPYGLNNIEHINQSMSLRNGFINYLQEKKAAGIVNVAIPGANVSCFFLINLFMIESYFIFFLKTSYVVHIFPPCQFSNETLKCRVPEIALDIEQKEHLFVVIATV